MRSQASSTATAGSFAAAGTTTRRWPSATCMASRKRRRPRSRRWPPWLSTAASSRSSPSSTRVTGFLWDRGRDRLWRQGIDLIGDDRRRQVSESIEDGVMLGQSEGGEFLDVTDDGFDDVAPVEQGLVEERDG